MEFENFKSNLEQFIQDCSKYSVYSSNIIVLITHFIGDNNIGKNKDYDTLVLRYLDYKLKFTDLASNAWFYLTMLDNQIQAMSK